MNNPDFNRVDFDTYRNEAWSNGFVMTPSKPPVEYNTTVWVDLWLKTFAVCSNGVEYPTNQNEKQSRKKIKKLQRQLA